MRGLAVEVLLMPLFTSGQVVSVPTGPYTVAYDGYEYRTMMSSVSVSGYGNTCHPSSGGFSLPSGYAIAPRSADIITEVIAKYGWDCAVLVVYDSSGFHNYYPAYLTGAQPRAGQVFGDSQAKAVRSSATGRYICPWTCYNILIRKQRDFDPGDGTTSMCTNRCPYSSDGDCDVRLSVAHRPIYTLHAP